MKKFFKGLLVTTAIAVSTVGCNIALAKPAEAATYAWTPGSYWGVNLNNMSQSDADKFCVRKVGQYTAYNTDSPQTTLSSWMVTHVWAHRQNNYCMLNTWGNF
jgi:hypothetical protein